MKSLPLVLALTGLSCTSPLIDVPEPRDTASDSGLKTDTVEPDSGSSNGDTSDTSDTSDTDTAGGGDTAVPEDSDGDGIPDELDDCPDDPYGWTDTDEDGVCEDDNDADGISNAEESTWGDDCSTSDPNKADSDQDGVDDGQDPYPEDPFAEYILFRNDEGTIDVSLSTRDGLFDESEQIGELYGGTKNTDYRYTAFHISDFNHDGATDFIALGTDTTSTSTTYDVWWFYRTDSKFEFSQRLLGTWDDNMLDVVGDIDSDEWVDLVALEIDKSSSGYVSTATLRSFMNQDLMETADCFATDDPTNPDGCAFVHLTGTPLSTWASGAWGLGAGRDMVDVDGDGSRDIALFNYSSGSNSAAHVTLARGNGDGTFIEPTTSIFEHNTGPCGTSPANVVVFGDFDGDDVGDMVLGLDDDGDAGSAWFYPGQITAGNYSTDFSNCMEAFDISPSYESGSEHPGYSSSARVFDFDFDGVLDIMLGFNSSEPWAPPSKTLLLWGQGDGSFNDTSPVTVREFSDSSYASNFAIPQRVCPLFPRAEE